MVCRHSHKSIARGLYELLLWWWGIDLSSYGNVLCDRETGHIFKYHKQHMISVNTKSITGFKFPMSYGEKEMVYYCISISLLTKAIETHCLLSIAWFSCSCIMLWWVISVPSNLGKFRPASILQTCDKLPPTIKLKKPKWHISRISTGAALAVSHFLWLDILRLISEIVPACSLWLNSMGLQQS